IRDDLGLDELADMHRIQIVALYAGAVFPLELVYDGQPPEEGATLCTAWTDAPVGGDCPNCTDLGDTSVVCPQRFWALSKHIEHHHPESGATDPVSAPFVAREHFRDGSPIPAPTRALVGASVEVYNALRVSPDDPDADAAARIEALGEAFADVVSVVRTFGECDVAADWDDWKAAIAAGGPGLLIAMPHQAGDSVTEASLEMGGAAETTFVERHIRTPGATPGPIVLLLGCDTSNAPTLLSSFASRMRKYAPVVVATIGRVIAAEAPHVAATVVRHLRTAAEADSGVAAALIAARRELLAESRLVGLQLIAHGDARWDFG
ncbi:MAG: hypothetical protein HKN41_02795, partial [Ilumatobacter sp.]|nr:hypothetical protein [Ilumatobacter sp.]